MTTPSATPDDGRPSAAARTRLAAELHDQLTSSRLAWDAALLRSDAALAAGDEAAVQAALDDHRLLLGALEERLGAVVAAAAVAREAEDTVRDVAPSAPYGDRTTDIDRHGPARTSRSKDATVVPSAALRRGASALAGAAAAVLLVVGLIGSDLRFAPDGLVAGTSTPADDADVRTRIASERIESTLPWWHDVMGPRATLPWFSGSLPPTDRADVAGSRTTRPSASTTPSEADAPADAPERPASGSPTAELPAADVPPTDLTTTDTPGADLPTRGVAPDGPETPGIDDVTEPLADSDAGDVDVGTSVPEPTTDAAEAVPQPLVTPPASDPTDGLG